MKMENSEKKQDVRKDLALAIKKLELFNDAQECTPVKKRAEQARSLIKLAFSEKARERERKKHLFIQREVLTAIQTIQKNYLFIQKLKKGTETEQALANSTLKVVQRYNQTIIKSSEKNLSLKTRISNFIYKHCGLEMENELEKKMIHLPVEAFVAFNYSASTKAHEKINQTAISFIQQELPTEHLISNQEADAFRAKAVSLLQNYGIRFTSVSEEFQTIRSTPIQAVIHSKDLRIMMTQVLKPFPGETIAFKGEFQKDSKDLHKSVPLRESFEVLSNYHQTGFPHPTQHTGFAFTDCLIPACPARLDLLKKFSILYNLKQEIASALLPKGDLNLKAKEILKLKKQVFNENKHLLIQKHVSLNKSILHAAPFNARGEHAEKIIEEFFINVETHETPYEYLGETFEIITYHFITRPFEKLKEDFVDHQTTKFYSPQVKKRYLVSLEILEVMSEKVFEDFELRANQTTGKDKTRLEYIIFFSKLIAGNSHNILLQHLSDTIGYIPPKLTFFEEKIQTVIYSQFMAFYKELHKENANKQEILNHFVNELERDTQIFKTNSFDELINPSKEIVKELETYYHDYFYSNA
jgi:hypothetical protein